MLLVFCATSGKRISFICLETLIVTFSNNDVIIPELKKTNEGYFG